MIATPRGADAARLRIAIPKGALFADSVAMLAGCDLDVTGLATPGRQLIVSTSDADYVIAKPTDVPIYVAYGGADCGIAGKDVLVEAALDVVEMVDLGFGGCRFVVAARAGTASLSERYEQLGVVRVATKYPGIAQAHFDEQGIQVEIVKLNGNIELAPLIGIADVIVDITATGTTLRENDLHIVDEVLPSTARFVGNPVAVRIDPRVTRLADAMSAQSVESSSGADTAANGTEGTGTDR